MFSSLSTEWVTLGGRRYCASYYSKGVTVSSPDFSCQLNRSMQYHLISFRQYSPGEPICLAVLGQNLAVVAFRLI